MIIFKPDWIVHGETSQQKGKQCIYSLDVHPDGKRLATGGIDTTVKVWNTDPIYDEKAEADPQCHRLLCTMTLHNGAVLCVRWSKDGRYLASSSDNDNVVIIWELDRDASSGAVFGSTDVNHETWRAVKYLRGHASDVQDLSWSYNNQYLASCGVDGFIIIWDARTFEQIHKINQHTGFVKGITWDPVSKYLASQSDDKRVKIWRTSDWQEEAQIEEPFHNAPGVTFFRRLSWSPEGSHIAAANAVNGNQCVAAIINRDNWDSDISLVGHTLPVEVTSFNPKMFYLRTERRKGSMSGEDDASASEATALTNGKDKVDSDKMDADPEPEIVDVCALGGQDRNVSIWVTCRSRPLCVAHDLFSNNVYDLAWSPSGHELFACSQDGTVACLQLEKELGPPVPQDEVFRRLEQYGYGRKHAMLPETPSQLDLENQLTKDVKSTAALPRLESLMSGSQREISIGSSSSSINGSGAANPIEIKEKSPSMDVDVEPVRGSQQFSSSSSTNTASTTAQEQKVTITKSGKRRIQPVAVVSSHRPSLSNTSLSFASAGAANHLHTGSLPGASGSGSMHAPLSSAARRSALETIDYAQPTLDGKGIPSLARGNKRTARDTDDVDNDDDPMALHGPGPARRRPKWIDNAVPPPITAQIHLGIPKVKSNLLHRIQGKHTAVMECQNLTTEPECTKLLLSKDGQEVWTDYLPHAIMLMTGNLRFYAVACEDASLVVYSPSGRRLLPPIILESTPVVLTSNEQWLLCLTECGFVYTWDMKEQRNHLAEVSIAPLLRVAQLAHSDDDNDMHVGPSLKEVRIQANGTPLVMTSYHQAFAYHVGMRAWLRISDAWYILSEFWGSGAADDSMDSHPLGWLSSALTKTGVTDPTHDSIKSLARMSDTMAATITLSHIENQLAACMVLESPNEYRQWLKFYVRRLAQDNAQTKVQELLQWLAGPPFLSLEQGQQWDPNILGVLSKQEILRELLPILAQNRQLQRITTDFGSLM
ncbi:WD40-repeat-containing domain protein [Gongronella butleri]|nr:WD40-repeat-containing domain protein [Gongronella butleri]